MFAPAPQPELVRSLQKDEYVLSLFRDDVREMMINVVGSNHWSYDAEVDLLSSLCYHGCTTLRGRPTLGEEYVDIMQVTNYMKQPSFQHRSILITLQCIVPYVYHKTRKHGRRWIQMERERPHSLNPDTAQIQLVQDEEISVEHTSSQFSLWISQFFASIRSTCTSFLSTLITLILKFDQYIGSYQKWHLAMFYLFGHYLQISKRMAGIRYVFLRRPDGSRTGYEMLGILLLIQLFITAIRSLLSYIRARRATAAAATTTSSSQTPSIIHDSFYHQESQSHQEYDEPSQDDNDDTMISQADTCTLCLSRRTDATVTECGHLFCWNCIAECCTNKPECPLCRQPCSLNQLILLAHYATSPTT